MLGAGVESDTVVGDVDQHPGTVADHPDVDGASLRVAQCIAHRFLHDRDDVVAQWGFGRIRRAVDVNADLHAVGFGEFRNQAPQLGRQAQPGPYRGPQIEDVAAQR